MKRILFLVITCILIDCLISCTGPGTTDYEFDVGTGYKLYRLSGHNIFVANASGNGDFSEKPMIPPKVVEIAWNDRYVIAKSFGLKKAYPDNPENTYEIPNETIVFYWILDTTADALYGGYSKEEFEKALIDFKIEELELKSINNYSKNK